MFVQLLSREEVKKNLFVVLRVHVFSGVALRSLFVPAAENEKTKT